MKLIVVEGKDDDTPHAVFDETTGMEIARLSYTNGDEDAMITRIEACVNALAGMNPDAVADVVRALERIKGHHYTSLEYAREQAATALAALKSKS